MNIGKAAINRRSMPIMVRLTPPMYDKLIALCKEAGGGIGTTVRSILEAALTEGVDVVDTPEELAEQPAPKRKRRPAPPPPTEAVAS